MINKAFMSILVQVFVWTYVFMFLGYVPRSTIARSYGNLMSNLLGNSQLFVKVAVPFYFPTCNVWGFQFLHTRAKLFEFLSYSHSDGYEVLSHVGFDLHFPDYWPRWASFHVPIGHLHVLFGKMSIQFCPFKIFIYFKIYFFPCPFVSLFFDVELYELFIYFEY